MEYNVDRVNSELTVMIGINLSETAIWKRTRQPLEGENENGGGALLRDQQ